MLKYNHFIYTHIGKLHEINKMKNRDTVFIDYDKDIVLYAVSDGVSAETNSHIGSKIACLSAANVILRGGFNEFLAMGPLKGKEKICRYIRQKLIEMSENFGQPFTSYAATLSLICINKKNGQAIIFNLGDGRIFIKRKNKDLEIFKGVDVGFGGVNENRVYCTVTDSAEYASNCDFIQIDDDVESICVCTDGLWKDVFGTENIDLNIIEEKTNEVKSERGLFDDTSFIIVT